MDADFKHNHNTWFVRMSEQALRAFAMGLVLTGQMLPAGAASAQDDPPSPSFAAPPAKPASGLTPVAVESPMTEEEAAPPVEAEENTAAPHPEEVTEESPPPAVDPAVTPPAEEVPATEESPAEASSTAPAAEAVPTPVESQPEPAAPEAPAAEAAPAPDDSATSEEAPAPNPTESQAGDTASPSATVDSTDPSKFQIGEWTMAIIPGPVPPKVIHEYRAPVSYEGYPANQNNLSVPVNVNVNNMASQTWPWASPWATPWGNLNYWNSPTAAYLFQHPQPYWQLRQDFYHLRPFIRGL